MKWHGFRVFVLACTLLAAGETVHTQPLCAAEPDISLQTLLERIEKLEQDNQVLRLELRQTSIARPETPSQITPPPAERMAVPPAPVDGTTLFADAEVPPFVSNDDLKKYIDEEIRVQTSLAGETQSVRLGALEKSFSDFKKSASEKVYPTAKLTGFFQADASWVTQDEENRLAIVNGVPISDIQDGASFRRARLAAVGDAYKNVGYMLEMDFAFPGRPTFMDVWLEVREVPGLENVRVGQFRQPFGMDAMTGVKELMFLERGLIQAFVPFRQIGASFADANEDYGLTWSGAVFRYPADFFGGNEGDSGGYGTSGRFTALLLEGDNNETIHAGLNYCFADPSNNVLQFRSQPELFTGMVPGAPFPAPPPANIPFFVDTGLIPTNNFNLFGAELAGSYGRWFAQSEYMITSVNQLGGPNLTFWGAYAQLAYSLTGEHHPYNKTQGVYTRIVPNDPLDFNSCNGIGAWEVAARYSILDLNSRNIQGNQLQDMTLGLNWYLNKNTKFQFNYIHAILDSPALSSNADLYALRAQVDF